MACCVANCPNKLNPESNSRSFPFPKTNYKSGKLLDLSKRRRNAWIRALRIFPTNANAHQDPRVCYIHFIKGCPAKLVDVNNPDWVPSRKLGVSVNRACEIAVKPNNSNKQVNALDSISNVEESLEISDNESFGGDGNDYDEPDIEFVPVTSASEFHSLRLNSGEKYSHELENVKTMNYNSPGAPPSSGLGIKTITDDEDFICQTKPSAFAGNLTSNQKEMSLEKLKIELKKKEAIIAMYEKKEKELQVKYSTSIKNLESKVKEYDFELKQLKVKLCTQDISFDGLKNDDEKVNNLTGLHNFALLTKLYDVVKESLNENTKTDINTFDSFILTLMKLRLDLPISYLSYIFGVPPLTMSKLYRENLATMNVKIGPLVKWPDDAILLLSTPSCFKEIMGDKCIVLIHFLEIFIKNLKPSMKGIQSMKHKIRYLISFTPAGEIIFVSQGFGSSATNEGIIEQSGFCDKITEHHIVLSVKDMFDEIQKGNEQIQRIKYMAKNTEDKVIDILKDNFRILFNRQPVNSNGEIYSEYTVRCCCALANLQMPELLVADPKETEDTVVVHTNQPIKIETIEIEGHRF